MLAKAPDGTGLSKEVITLKIRVGSAPIERWMITKIYTGTG